MVHACCVCPSRVWAQTLDPLTFKVWAQTLERARAQTIPPDDEVRCIQPHSESSDKCGESKHKTKVTCFAKKVGKFAENCVGRLCAWPRTIRRQANKSCRASDCMPEKQH